MYNIKDFFYFVNEDKNKKPNNYWTKEKLQEEVDKYNTRGDFWKFSPSAASIANNMRIIDELFKNHTNKGYTSKRKVDGYWTKEKLQEEVNKYKTRKDFRKNNEGAYTSAWRRKLLDDLFKNHPNEYLSKKIF